MKRIIKTDGQIIDGERGFAIYCTVGESFSTVGNNQTWESADDLASDYDFEISRVRLDNPPDRDHQIRDLTAMKARCVGLARGNGY
jgi:hypothetical protein